MVESRIFGSLLGLAVCDAIGTTVEFMPPGSFTPVNGMIGGGKFNLSPGQWTDDTSMALCLAESIIECQGFNPIDQAKRYWRWYQEGHLSSTGECFDIGMTVCNALNKFQRSGEKDSFPGSTSPRAAGNGCLMRLAPVPLSYWKYPLIALELSGASAKVTHGPQVAVDACKYFAGLLIGCLNGVSKEELLSEKYSPVPDYWEENEMVSEVLDIACGSYKSKQPPDIKASGYVISSMEAALWSFYHTNNFKDGCLKAVNLGDDADTVGAIYGQLAGAYYGVDDIPKQWRETTYFVTLIELFASELSQFSSKSAPQTDVNWQQLSPRVPTDQLSLQYQYNKVQCYDLLETKSQDTIYRFSKPCPKQYNSLEEFDEDVASIKEMYCLLPEMARNDKLLKDFEKNWMILREKLKLRIQRTL